MSSAGSFNEKVPFGDKAGANCLTEDLMGDFLGDAPPRDRLGEMSASGDLWGERVRDLTGDLERLVLDAALIGDFVCVLAGDFPRVSTFRNETSSRKELSKEFSKLVRMGLQLSPKASSPMELEELEMCDRLLESVDRRGSDDADGCFPMWEHEDVRSLLAVGR